MFGYSCHHDHTLTHIVNLAYSASRLLVDIRQTLEGLSVLGCQRKSGHLLDEALSHCLNVPVAIYETLSHHQIVQYCCIAYLLVLPPMLQDISSVCNEGLDSN